MLGCDIGGVLTETPIRRNSPSTRLKFPFLRFDCGDDPSVQFGRYLCLYLFSLNTPKIPLYWSQLLRWPFYLISGDFVLYFCMYKLNIQYTNFIQDMHTSLSDDINQDTILCITVKRNRDFSNNKSRINNVTKKKEFTLKMSLTS